MKPSVRPGEPAPPEILVDVEELLGAYYGQRPNPDDPAQRVGFGTSGHRGSSLDGAFNEAHILAITQAICEYRRLHGFKGPLFVGKDTHALSAPAEKTALEVLAANGVETVIQRETGFTPTPVISRSILAHNSSQATRVADGIVITPSHNPPRDGGFKYNPPHGGPADTDVTGWIQDRANQLMRSGNREVDRVTFEAALRARTTRAEDMAAPYIEALESAIDFDVIKSAGLRIGVDPLGGAAVHYWTRIAERYGLNITVVNPDVDSTFSFMPVDHDGKIRMDCSSPYAMSGLAKLKDSFDIAWGNDPDTDRHGIVTQSVGLMNPNHYLAVAIRYLLKHRPNWSADSAVGKTLVSSGLIDRVVSSLGRRLVEVPVGFKWFVSGLLDGSICFGGEESAGASFLQKSGSVWTTDKDGILLGLLAAEITGRTGKDPGEHYKELTAEFGTPYYTRIDAPATPAEKAAFKKLVPQSVSATELAGELILAKLTVAPGNSAPIGGLKVTTKNGWFAARPSGTENIYKVYAESFVGESHLAQIVEQSQAIVRRTLSA